MRKFTVDEMLTAFQLEQMLYDYIEELDLNGSKNAGAFFTEDGAFVTPGGSFVGPVAIQAFYVMAAKLSKARGLDPDRPRHLSKVTRTN